MLAHVGDRVLQAHPMIPLLQVSADESMLAQRGDDLDLEISGRASQRETVAALRDRIADTASQHYQPKVFGRGFVRFQLTRGLLGVSL